MVVIEYGEHRLRVGARVRIKTSRGDRALEGRIGVVESISKGLGSADSIVGATAHVRVRDHLERESVRVFTIENGDELEVVS